MVTAHVSAQTPRPFPLPGEPRPPQGTQPAPPPPGSKSAAPAAPAPSGSDGEPSAGELVFPVFPDARFLASYDAGRDQRYYLYGSTGSFADIVAFYRAQLKERGSLVFREPPTHMFEVGRFRDETMAFPPGVTVKDWTWGGSKGYPVAQIDARPDRFPTVIMIVPPQPGAPK